MKPVLADTSFYVALVNKTVDTHFEQAGLNFLLR